MRSQEYEVRPLVTDRGSRHASAKAPSDHEDNSEPAEPGDQCDEIRKLKPPHPFATLELMDYPADRVNRIRDDGNRDDDPENGRGGLADNGCGHFSPPGPHGLMSPIGHIK